MTDHKDQLREAFETHEELAPDPAVVYARVQELARGYRWRRRGAQAAGGAMLGAGLIAAVITLPALPSTTPHGNAPALAVGAPASPSAPSQAELQKDWNAYFNAGYGYDDAVKLAQLWHMDGNDIGSVKAEAGRRLLAGQGLPIKPGPENPDTTTPLEARQLQAFFAAGYTYDDAVRLAQLWHTVDPYHAKIEGGKQLLAGQVLPIKPRS